MKRRNLLAYGTLTLMGAPFAVLSGPARAADGLTDAGPLPDNTFGEASAPVTIIEYMSMTCPHCRAFHVDTWPEIKRKYVDTGKVKFIFREFPFDPRSTAAFMLARCMGKDKWSPTVDLLFRTQEKWARAEDGRDALQSTMAVTGMSKEQFETCLRDQSLLDKVTAVAERGKKLGVDATPTFFVNGKKYSGALPEKEFSKLIDALLPAE